MTDTPIIDEAIRQVSNLQEIGYTDIRVLVGDALRAALPWDLPAERLEAMAMGLYDAATKWSQTEAVRKRHGWKKATDLHEKYRACALAAYRDDPIMAELYPERFNVVA